MKYELSPYEGAGPIRLGMTRDVVRSTLDSPWKAFKRTAWSTSETDAFENVGIQVEYDLEGRCESVTIASPAFVTLHGRPLLGIPFQALREWLLTLDPDLQTDGSGLTSLALGVGLYAPSALKDPKDPVEAAIVFRRGYYD